MSCCPPNSHPYLAAPGNTKGVIHEVSDALSYYEAGNVSDIASSGAVILIPDIWGWNSGRTRNIADHIHEMTGYYIMIPKLLVPAFEGGTDGDGKGAGHYNNTSI